MSKTAFWALIVFLVIIPGRVAHAEPIVVVSLKPIHSIAAAVMEGVSTPILLMEGATTPHGASLKPSHVRRLNQADLIVWIGPSLESSIQRVVTQLDANIAIVTAMELPNMHLRLASPHDLHQGHEESEDHQEQENHDDDHGHERGEGSLDPHLWLDTHNMIVLANAIAAKLTAIDPDNANHYQRNLAGLTTKLAEVDRDIMQALKPIQSAPFMVFHDAYGYFTDRYRLRQVASLRAQPNVAGGIRRAQEIRQLIVEEGVKCIFTEPQFDDRFVRLVSEDQTVDVSALDPLGASIPAGKDMYAALMRQLSRQFIDCLS